MSIHKLKGVISGIMHSGTTLLSNTLTSGKEVFNKYETGFLLKSTLSGKAFVDDTDDIDVYGNNAKSYLRFLKDIYQLTENEIYQCGESENWYAAYDTLFEICKQKETDFPYTHIIDKTPAYGRNLSVVTERIPDTPVIFTFCDPRKFTGSYIRRHLPRIQDKDKCIHISIEFWSFFIKQYTSFIQLNPDRVMPIRYEDMIINLESVLKKTCDYFSIQYSPKMLNLNNAVNASDKVDNSIYKDEGILNSKIYEYKEFLSSDEENYILEHTKDYKEFWY